MSNTVFLVGCATICQAIGSGMPLSAVVCLIVIGALVDVMSWMCG